MLLMIQILFNQILKLQVENIRRTVTKLDEHEDFHSRGNCPLSWSDSNGPLLHSTRYVYSLMHDARKWSSRIQNFCSICYKIFSVCLIIVLTLGLLGLNCVLLRLVFYPFR